MAIDRHRAVASNEITDAAFVFVFGELAGSHALLLDRPQLLRAAARSELGAGFVDRSVMISCVDDQDRRAILDILSRAQTVGGISF